ncbi:hypothetical protein HU742_011295 [Pseudomonas sp. SWRI102]|uniref:Uncharacterized protein n=1 Tax=Pseudomonas marvdashtae TaxID=2745500 RepID=A0A923FKG6_9PSED|nr:hypothetical protein [Pseudomonas marvdashtae]MBV4551721.1 hypothetical protein [Pseudomonas marvdashtae]
MKIWSKKRMNLGSPDAYISLVSGLVGAFVGGFFTLKGATNAHKLALKKEETADRERMITTLMLLRTEIAGAWELFMEECGDELSKPAGGAPFLNILPVGKNPFPIFDSGPPALNLLPRELAKDVVHFYMRAKGLIATIEMNNHDYEQALQYARVLLINHAERAQKDGEEFPDEKHDQLFNGGVDFMAGQLGMGDTAEAIRSLAQELTPIVKRITTEVDELFFSLSDNQKRTN